MNPIKVRPLRARIFCGPSLVWMGLVCTRTLRHPAFSARCSCLFRVAAAVCAFFSMKPPWRHLWRQNWRQEGCHQRRGQNSVLQTCQLMGRTCADRAHGVPYLLRYLHSRLTGRCRNSVPRICQALGRIGADRMHGVPHLQPDPQNHQFLYCAM